MKTHLYSDISAILQDLIARYESLSPISDQIFSSYQAIAKSFENGNKLLVCGNGGSSSDALHIVGELMKCFTLARPIDEKTLENLQNLYPNDAEYFEKNIENTLPAIALVENSALSTAFSNDACADLVFAQQVNGLGKQGDVLLCISTSGSAKNAVLAAKLAKAKGLMVIALTGGTGGELKQISDISIIAPQTETFKVQELHLPIYHALCMMLEYHFFQNKKEV